jgi:branched-chain amino acid transport system permease protein
VPDVLERALKLVTPVAAPCVLLFVVVLLVAELGSQGTQNTTVSALISVIVVVGMYVFVGNSGIVSFGHIGFMAIGAYATALVTIPKQSKAFLFPEFPQHARFIMRLELGPVEGAVLAALFTLVFAMIIGFPLMRLAAFQSGMATLALLIVISVVISNWEAVTHGTSTIIGVPPHATVWSALVVALLTIAGAYLYQISGRGLRLRAAREDEYAASAAGINIVLERWIAFGISGFFVALGGAMYAFYLPFASATFYLPLTFLTVAMLIIGGRNSLWGAVVGVVLVSTVSEVLRRYEAGASLGPVQVTLPSGSTEVVLALVMLTVLLLRPDGLTGGVEVTWPLSRPFRRGVDAELQGAGVDERPPATPEVAADDPDDDSRNV